MITTDHHIFFYTNYLSNWWSTRDIKPQFTDPVSKIAWNNTEEAFMAAKAQFFGDEETHALIVEHAKARGHPREVKALGRLVKGYDEAEWSCVRKGFMAHVNLMKYRQNPDLAAQLKATGNRILVEASPVDLVWGAGLNEEDCLKHEQNSSFVGASLVWPGRNLLGKALMTVRDLLQDRA